MAIQSFNMQAAYQSVSRMNLEQHGHTQHADQTNSHSQTTYLSAQQTTQSSLVSHLFGGTPSEQAQNGLKMTYQAAIDKLNEQLQADLGEHFKEGEISEENLKAKGMEHWTPENTAKRIVEGATGFLAGFQAANPELEGEALMSRYMEVVGSGLRQGFSEAKGILNDLKVFEGGIEQTFTQTLELVNFGMENFRRDQLGLPTLEANEQNLAELGQENIKANWANVSIQVDNQP